MKFIQLLFYQPVLLTTLGLLTISPPVLADLQTSENYVLSATVLSNGSGEANSSEYSLTATVGPPLPKQQRRVNLSFLHYSNCKPLLKSA